MPKSLTAAAIDRVIRRHLARLTRRGVLTVRPGFEIAGHQLTGRMAIVVTVHTKTSDLPARELLPASLGGIRVDVREATPLQRLHAGDPAAAALMQAFGPPENVEPQWPLEREMPGGRLLTAPARPAMDPRLTKKPQLPYVPAAGQPLLPVQLTTTITASVSPDAGFATLTRFLQGTRQSLVIGLYDFTSGPLLAEFENVLGAGKTLQMVLDNPAPNPTRNQTDTQTVAALDAALQSRAHIVRALSRSDALADAWIFPSAYHIKVIVRDRAVLWLSSGNLNNSNQPDPAVLPKTQDRDWHVIIEDEPLAALFAAYLDQDFASAKTHQVAAPALRDALADAAAKLAAETTPLVPPLPMRRAASRGAPRADDAPPDAVAAQVFTNIPVTLTPVLTPDAVSSQPGEGQYLSTMVKLLGSARKSLYAQLQYIESSSAANGYDDLLQAIAQRVAAGVDVRLIESLQYGEKWAEKMKAAGVDLTANISLQPDVHNKGFVIDSQIVVVSSQNFSPEGVRLNRDAGLIIDSAPVARYFEAVFLSDWTRRATPFARNSAKPAARLRRAPRA